MSRPRSPTTTAPPAATFRSPPGPARRRGSPLGPAAAPPPTLAPSPIPPAAGQPVPLTATAPAVAPGAGVPTGTVNFKDGSTVIGSSIPLNASGVATFTTSSLSSANHNLTALYNGSG